MSRRQRWRQHLAPRSKDFVRGNWSGLFKFSEFFVCYLKFTTRAEWQGAQSKQSGKIEYLLNTYDDWATAPPQQIGLSFQLFPTIKESKKNVLYEIGINAQAA
mgnify:FL=1